MGRRHREIREVRRRYEAAASMTGYDMVELLMEQGWNPPVEVGRVEGTNPLGQTFVQVLFECHPGSSARAEAWGSIGCEVVLDPDMQAEVGAGTRNLAKMAAEAAIKAIIEREQREGNRPAPVNFP